MLYSFNDAGGSFPAGALLNAGSTLYGTTWSGGKYHCGTVFSITTADSEETALYSFGKDSAHGCGPLDTLAIHGSELVGTTWYEGTGPSGVGSVFSYDLATRKNSFLHFFEDNGIDGIYPYAGVTRVGDTLFGTTTGGGPHNGGVVFSIAP
jgi:uncharacterized repeat protein (TIGR03803 family)